MFQFLVLTQVWNRLVLGYPFVVIPGEGAEAAELKTLGSGNPSEAAESKTLRSGSPSEATESQTFQSGNSSSCLCGQAWKSQGFRVRMPVPLKSFVLRVTTTMLWTRAVAAIKEFRSHFLSGTCSVAQRLATDSSMLSVKSANVGRTWFSNQLRSMAPWAASARS